MKKAVVYNAVGIVVCIVLTLLLIFGIQQEPKEKVEEIAAAEVICASKYDTSYLKSWCGEPIGTVRMLAGWYADKTHIETEDGEIWEMNTEGINEFEVLLIWIDDMSTPEIEDDEIIKIWSEVYD